MAVYLDDEPVAFTGDRLPDALATAQARLEGTGRMIVEIQLDGRVLAGDALTEHADDAVTDASELRLYSADPRALAQTALQQARDQLLEQRPTLESAAALLQQDRPADAMQQVTALNEVWLTTMQTVERTAQLMAVDLATLTVDGRAFPQITADLLTQLRQLKQHLTDRDTAALADALGYEWPRLIEQWDAVLGTLLDRTDAD